MPESEVRGSKDQHTVAVTKKSISSCHGLPITFQDKFSAGKSAHEHEKRGCGKVKVGKEPVDDLEPEAGVYEEVAPSDSRRNPARGLTGLVFQGPCCGSSYRHELLSYLLPLVNKRGGVLRHFIILWFQD